VASDLDEAVAAAVEGEAAGGAPADPVAGIDPAIAVHFRDKSLQKRRIAEAGLRTARVTVIEDVHDVSAITELEYPRAVLKPVAGAATTRTTVVESLADLQRLSKQYRKDRTAQRTFVLEEFVDGDEWIADGVVFDGELVFCALGSYGSPCLTVVDQGLPLSMRRFDPKTDAWAYELGEPFVRRAIAALGLRSGAFHLEFFRGQDDTLTFGECAARRGGGLIHEEVQRKFNVHLGAATVRCALGRAPGPQVEYRPETVGTTFLMGRPGTLISCPSPAELMEQPGVVLARIEFPAGGQFAEGLGSTNQRIGQVLVTADSAEGLQLRFAELREWFAARTVIAPFGGSQRELRAWQRDARPDLDFQDILWG
jgi:biotin carboxylase